MGAGSIALILAGGVRWSWFVVLEDEERWGMHWSKGRAVDGTDTVCGRLRARTRVERDHFGLKFGFGQCLWHTRLAPVLTVSSTEE